MNNRQAAALREQIRAEEKARENWFEKFGEATGVRNLPESSTAGAGANIISWQGGTVSRQATQPVALERGVESYREEQPRGSAPSEESWIRFEGPELKRAKDVLNPRIGGKVVDVWAKVVPDDQQPMVESRSARQFAGGSAPMEPRSSRGGEARLRTSGQAIIDNSYNNLSSGSASGTTSGGGAASLGLKLSTGVMGCQVVRVAPQSAAEEAGIKINDLITHVNNRPTRHIKEFKLVLDASQGPLNIALTRNGPGRLQRRIMRK